MELIATTSSMFDGYLYRPEQRTLTVRYRGTGDLYAYQDISPELYEEFAEAESIGKFFNARIKGKFEAIKGEPDGVPVEDSRPGVTEMPPMGAIAGAGIDRDDMDTPTDIRHTLQATPTSVIPVEVLDKIKEGFNRHDGVRHICHECGVNLDDDKDCYACGAPQQPCAPHGHVACVVCNRTLDLPETHDIYRVTGDGRPTKIAEGVQGGFIDSKPDGVHDDNVEALAVAAKARSDNPEEEQLARDIHEHGKSEAMTAPPRVISEPEVPTTPAEAIALLSEEMGYVGATIAQAKDVADTALAVKVKDHDSYSAAGDMVVKLTGMKDRAVGFLDPIRKVLYEPYKLAQEKLKAASEPLEGALQHLKKQRVSFQQEQDRLAEVERQRLQKIADEEARQRQKELSQQMTMAEIEDRKAQGDEEGAAELLEKPIQAAPVYVPPVRVEAPIVKTEGVSMRANWKAEIPGYPESTVEFEKLVLSVAEGLVEMAASGTLKGHAPISVLMPNMTTLNQKAKADKKSFSLPGVRAWNDATEVSRRGRS